MQYRRATEQDINWVWNHLRQSARDELAENGRDPEELKNSTLLKESNEVWAVVNDAGQAVALIGLTEVKIEFRPGTAFILLYGTEGIEKERIGFLKAVKHWVAHVAYADRPWDEIWTWVSANRQKNYDMLVKYLKFKYESTIEAAEPGQSASHLVFHRREFLKS